MNREMHHPIVGTAPVAGGCIEVELDVTPARPVNRGSRGLECLSGRIYEAQTRTGILSIAVNPDSEP